VLLGVKNRAGGELCVQGIPLATRLNVRVIAVRGLTIADQVSAVTQEEHEDEEDSSTTYKQDGVAIEISSPLAVVRFLHSSSSHFLCSCVCM
jgi:hypothetical protein